MSCDECKRPQGHKMACSIGNILALGGDPARHTVVCGSLLCRACYEEQALRVPARLACAHNPETHINQGGRSVRVPVTPWTPDTDECAYLIEVRSGPAGPRVMVTLTWHDQAHGARPHVLKMALAPDEARRVGEALVQVASVSHSSGEPRICHDGVLCGVDGCTMEAGHEPPCVEGDPSLCRRGALPWEPCTFVADGVSDPQVA